MPTLDSDRLSFEFEAGPDKPRLDQFIALQLPKVSLTRIRRLIAEGDVSVNGTTSAKGARLQAGDRVAVKIFSAEKSSATPEPIPLEILYEDDSLIVVNKPVGLLVHPSNSEKSGTLTNGLAYHFWRTGGEAIRPGIVHRLDRNTSGVILVAKTPRAHRTLSKYFRDRRVRKFYLTLVSGRVEPPTGEIQAPIGCDPKTWPHWRVMDEGKPAQTRYQAIRRLAAHTLLELEPLTGRTHQLRIHCNLIGHPIVGDPIYASQADPLAATHQLKYHLLHASRLVFRHPATNQEMDVKAPIPAAMRQIIEML
ncbi:MAG TPA: RluA family pseudouridine synthase [Blastocatellia bacterium]|nr:RluA family pseudouridine synthase [Blastocatellia bacterium]